MLACNLEHLMKQKRLFMNFARKITMLYMWIVNLPFKTPKEDKLTKKAQLSLTNPRDACEKFSRFM